MKALLNPTTDELNFIDAFRRSADNAKENAVNIMKNNPQFMSERFCIRKTFINDFVEAFDNGKLDKILNNIIVMM